MHLYLVMLKLRVHGTQEDIQLPLAPMPVLSRPQKDGEDRDFMMEFSMITQSNDSSEDHFQAGLALRVKLCVLLKITMVNNLVDRGIDSWEEGPPKAPPSHLTLYSSSRPTEAEEQVSVIKCSHQTDQAMEVYSDQ
ncbi:C2 domain-containing family protein [Salix suchowensis]|nr:C2 domain-containing family protein [Salix suchowensis]